MFFKHFFAKLTAEIRWCVSEMRNQRDSDLTSASKA